MNVVIALTDLTISFHFLAQSFQDTFGGGTSEEVAGDEDKKHAVGKKWKGRKNML